MLKFIVFGVAAYLLYKLVANDFLKKRKAGEEEEKAATARKVEAGEMVKDPVCGVYVDKESSISVRDGETKYYFCSYDCRDKFLQRLETGANRLPDKDGDRE